MDRNPFRQRPFLEIGIDLWKVVFVAIVFVVFLGWYAYTW